MALTQDPHLNIVIESICICYKFICLFIYFVLAFARKLNKLVVDMEEKHK